MSARARRPPLRARRSRRAGSLLTIAVAIGGPDEFVAVRDELMRRGLADAVVYDAVDWLSIHAADRDGLFREFVLPQRPRTGSHRSS